MEQAVATRRERKRQSTTDAVRAMAIELFAARGFDAVSVEQVASAADVSPSTVYRHFPTKEDLVLSTVVERQAALLAALDTTSGVATLGELLTDATLGLVAAVAAHRSLRSLIALIVDTPALLERLHHLMVEWEVPVVENLARRCGRAVTDLELQQYAVLYCATIRIVLRQWASTDVSVDLVAFGRGAVAALDALPAARFPIS